MPTHAVQQSVYLRLCSHNYRYRIFCVDESVYRVIADSNPNYCQAPSPAVSMDVRRWLRPTLYYLDLLWICRTTYRRHNNG